MVAKWFASVNQLDKHPFYLIFRAKHTLLASKNGFQIIVTIYLERTMIGHFVFCRKVTSDFIACLGLAYRGAVQDAQHPLQQLQDPGVQVLRAGEVVSLRQELYIRPWT